MNKQWVFQSSSQKENAKHPNQNHRNESIMWAVRKLTEGNFVILDTETTGTCDVDQVVQVGILSSTGEVLYSGLVKPINAEEFDEEVVRIHGISYAMVKNAPTLNEIIGEIKSKVSDRTILAYNAAFDKRLFNQSCTIAKVSAPAWNWECVMLQYAKFIGEPGRNKGEYRWQKLPRKDVKQTHDATADCLLTLQLLERIASSRGYKV